MSESQPISGEFGCLMLKAGELHWVPRLREIYQFESARVSKPGSWKTDIRSVLWTFDELVAALKLGPQESAEYRSLLDELVKSRHAMEVIRPPLPPRYVTRVAETVRLLGHTYEYWHDGSWAIDAVRWLTEFKRVPRRDLTTSKFEDDLESRIQKEARPEWRKPLSQATRLVVPKVAEAITHSIRKGPDAVRFSRFQFESTAKMLASEFGKGDVKPAQVIVSGVGSGKTYAFMIPTLISAIARLKKGEDEQRVTLLLYPRKALAKSQAEVIYDLAGRIGYPSLRVLFDYADQYTRMGYKSVRDGIRGEYGGGRPPPHVVVTTLETLNRRLRNPDFMTRLPPKLKRVVADEIHLIEGLSGSHVIRVIDRLRNAAEASGHGEGLLWTGSSATVAHPHVHAGVVFNVKSEKVDVIQPANEDTDPVGLVHHVFLRPSGNISNIGALVDATSIVVHNRRRDLGARAAQKGDGYQKTIGFADNLDLLGRWNADLRENERTESGDRGHSLKEKVEEWTPRQREVPYAARFHDPLQARIDAEHPSIRRLSDKLRKKGVCESCRKGTFVELGKPTADDLECLSELVYRRPMEDRDKIEVFHIQAPTVLQGDEGIGNLDACPYLRAGACFWFPEEAERPERIPSTDYHEWAAVARSKIHSAKTGAEDLAEEGEGEVVFKAPVQSVYDVRGKEGRDIPVDVVLASPSLEVGVDLKLLTESVMFHAIRNVASYRQKVGRVGREEGSDTLNATLMANRPIDLHYYRQPRKLVSVGQLDPIPLKDSNMSTLKNSLYASVWDWLALEAGIPEAIPGTGEGGSEFAGRLEASLERLKASRGALAEYLQKSSRGRVGARSLEVGAVIEQVEEEIGFLLADASTTFEGKVARLADLVPLLAPQKLARHVALTAEAALVKTRLDNYGGEYSRLRQTIIAGDRALEATFRNLDMMAQAGWDTRQLNRCLEDLERWAASAGRISLDMEETIGKVKLISRVLSDWGKDALPLYFFSQLKEIKARSDNWKLWYLSDMMTEVRVFDVLRKQREFVRERNLFTSRYEHQVEVVGGGPLAGQTVPLTEALFSLIPGTWTYRFGRRPVKVKSGRVEPTEGGILAVSLARLRKDQGCVFEKVGAGILGPPGVVDKFDVYRPVRLRATELRDSDSGGAMKEKYVRLNRALQVVQDDDEYPAKGAGTDPVKIPKSFLNRWVHVRSEKERPTGVSLPAASEGTLAILNEGGAVLAEGHEAATKIIHPVAKALLAGVSWHESLVATDFVYSVSRTYSKGGAVDLLFYDENSRPIGLGRSIETEGLSLDLEPTLVREVKEHIEKAILSGAEEWAPTAMKALESFLVTTGMGESARASPFVVKDLFAIATTSLGRKGKAWSLESMSEELQSLAADPDALSSLAREHFRAAAKEAQSDEESRGGKGREVIEADDFVEAKLRTISSVAAALAPSLPGFRDRVGSWVIEALLTSFGVAALNALQRMAGVGDNVVAYAVDFEGVQEGRYRVFLFDKDEKGNGSSDVARRFLHILHIQRHGTTWDSMFLPSDDFFSVLEEELLQCPQHHADSVALEIHSAGGGRGIPALGYVRSQAEEVFANNGETWKAIGITGRADMPKLPMLYEERADLADRLGLELDDVVRATTVCWNGCPECLLSDTQSGGLAETLLLDKALLDEWFSRGRQRCDEYKEVDLQKLGAGEVALPLGNLSGVVLDLQNPVGKRVRSVSLPHTIGLELPRRAGLPVKLIMRTSDIVGYSLFEMPAAQPAMGIEAMGFKRLFWNDLVLTCFLDLLGYIPPDRRVVKLVFYDARDVGFSDAGVSERMLGAITELDPSASGLREPERLSDILVWLARRGFKVSMCIDSSKMEESVPKRFAELLATGGCEVVEKDLKVEGHENIMHKKILITPLSVMQGSANLTESGTKWNEEIVNYVPRAAPQYGPLATSLGDTFIGARPLE